MVIPRLELRSENRFIKLDYPATSLVAENRPLFATKDRSARCKMTLKFHGSLPTRSRTRSRPQPPAGDHAAGRGSRNALCLCLVSVPGDPVCTLAAGNGAYPCA